VVDRQRVGSDGQFERLGHGRWCGIGDDHCHELEQDRHVKCNGDCSTATATTATATATATAAAAATAATAATATAAATAATAAAATTSGASGYSVESECIGHY
jgi:hypothetical protein